ncbi:S-methyl-5-thioribose-1-phosphate isomerase [Knufia fluminis]|uniref:Methylthioribose-1-phosphate isomerase n=1 Tax=Knufia fluminis TaxID=191047 RepID=A0AAN8EHM1_9EURO|nr:S-methyl-5-thioribose-1-phosphate isomerase [Knufia fluminis]
MVLQAIKYTPASGDGPASLEILDQLQIPHRTVYEPIKNCEDGFKAIKQMKVRGAPAIAIVAALTLAVELGTTYDGAQSAAEAKDHIIQRLEYLKTSRPTAVNLGDAVGKLSKIVTTAASSSATDSQAVVKEYIAAAERMLVDDVADNKAIGANGAKWIMENTEAGKSRASNAAQELSILTICNTGSLATAGYGTALGVIRSLHNAQCLTRAYASETRPYNQGSRLTAYELVHDNIPATLITDSMAGSIMAREGSNIAAVIVGADRVATNGDTANKIGTYSLAVLARHHGVKFLVAAPRTTVDRATASGEDIVIEERAGHEVTQVRGPQVIPEGGFGEPATVSTAAIGVDVWNPAFDVTPANLIDGIITEVGVVEKASGSLNFNFDSIFASMTKEEADIKPSSIGGM